MGSREVSSPENLHRVPWLHRKRAAVAPNPAPAAGCWVETRGKGKKAFSFILEFGLTMAHHSCHSCHQAGTERCFAAPTTGGTLPDKSRLHRTEDGEERGRRGRRMPHGLHSPEARCPVVMSRPDCELASTRLSARGTATPRCNRSRRQDALEFRGGGVEACARLTRGDVHDAPSLVLAPCALPPACSGVSRHGLPVARTSLSKILQRFENANHRHGLIADAGQARARAFSNPAALEPRSDCSKPASKQALDADVLDA